MGKKRIIWLSNVDLLDDKQMQSGTWMHSMFKALSNSNEITICANITFTKKKNYYKKNWGGTIHYYVPVQYINKRGLPSKGAKEYIINSIIENAPHILHVWGTEFFWGTLIDDQRLIQYRTILEIQGLKLVWGEKFSFFGGLGGKELRQMRGLGRWILPSHRIESMRKKFVKWGAVEKEIIPKFDYINTQSEWVRTVLPFISENLNIKRTGILLRDSFIYSEPWYKVHVANESPVIFTTASTAPWKGFHITMRAFALIKKYYPNATLKVAGIDEWTPSFSNCFKGGYNQYLKILQNELYLSNSVEYLGKLSEKDLLANMYSADVFVVSSFIESYCLALAEALSIGVPTVSSNTSALPELINDEETGFLYPIGDYYVCASKIIRLIEDNNLKKSLSLKSSQQYRNTHKPIDIVNQQIKTYLEI